MCGRIETRRFCDADRTNGEILVLAVAPDYEGQGVGKTLLATAVKWLRTEGWKTVWLASHPDPTTRLRLLSLTRMAAEWKISGQRRSDLDAEHRFWT
jgi:GNAT superfamily N-acetyltransferase